VTLRLAPKREESRVVVTVEDTGIGIPPEKIETIFEKFSQADASMSRKYGGSGLGLAICRSLSEIMGGTICVESVPGKGSTFRVELPLRFVRDEEGAAGAPDTLPAASERPLKILLAEDSPDNQRLIAAFLKETPHRLTVVANGREAVEMFRTQPFDLVFMDVQMPEMDGYTATRAIRRLEAEEGRPPTPVIALTAHAFAEDRKRSVEAGCTAHLTKPIKKVAFLEAIAQYAGEGGTDFPRGSAEGVPQQSQGQPAGILVEVDAFLAPLVPEFLANLAHDLRLIREAAERSDFESARLLGHRMKGAGGGYGFDRITEFGKAIEEAARQGERRRLLGLCDEVARYLDQVEVKYV